MSGTREGSRPFRVYATDELQSIPPPEYLIDGFLVKGGLNVLFGPFDTYKTFVALDWSLTIAAGLGSWFGHKAKSGSVVYIAGEGGGGLWQRIDAWADHRGCDLPEAHWIAGAINMFVQAEAVALLEWIESLPVAPMLVVFDTTSRCSVGADENSARDMGIVVSNMDRIRTCGAAVLAIHHTGHENPNRERGSSGFAAAADGRISVASTAKLKATITPAKMKDAEKGEPLTVELEPHLRSLVIARAGTRTQNRESSIRDAIIAHLAQHPRSSQNTIEGAVKYQRERVRDALSSLVDSGEVVREDGARQSYLYSLVTAPHSSGRSRAHSRATPKSTAPAPPLSKGGAVEEAQSTAPHDAGAVGSRNGRRDSISEQESLRRECEELAAAALWPAYEPYRGTEVAGRDQWMVLIADAGLRELRATIDFLVLGSRQNGRVPAADLDAFPDDEIIP